MSRSTWRFGPVLLAIFVLAACTAPPRPVEAEPTIPAIPAPPVRVRVSVVEPGQDAAALDASVAQPLEAALAEFADVEELFTRSAVGRVDVIATLGPAATLDAVRAAVEGVRERLPEAAESPLLTRIDGVQPALAIATQPEVAGAIRAALERTAGVGRVEVCGLGERRTAVVLDRSRLAPVAIDRLIAAVETAAAADGPAPLQERVARQTIADNRQVGDVAVLQDRLGPLACRAYTARGPVVLLTAFTQSGADPAQVAAAHVKAVDLVSPTVDFFADEVPATGEPGLAVLAAELTRSDGMGAALATCLAAVPGLPRWALEFPDTAATEPLARVRLLVGSSPAFPIEHVRNAMSQCAGVKRVAVLAPQAEADHAVGLRFSGPDPQALAALADRAAARIAAVSGVTGLQVRAAREQPPAVQLSREALAAHGLAADRVALVVRLAAGPLTIFGTFGTREPIDIDVLDRSGSLEQLMAELRVGPGLIPLAGLASLLPASHGPLYRVDRRPAAVIDVRIRRASDREAVIHALQQEVEIPKDYFVVHGQELPGTDP